MRLAGHNSAVKNASLRCVTGIILATSGCTRIGTIEIETDPGAHETETRVPDQRTTFVEPSKRQATSATL